MKFKIVLLLLTIVIAKGNFAQKTSVGFSGGVSIASMHAKADNISETTKWTPGVTAGIYLMVPASQQFIFMPGINLVQKGAVPKDLDPDEKSKLTLNYLELPLNFLYSSKGFMIGAGPTIGYGLWGNSKYSSDTYPEENEKINFGNSEDDDIRPLELGGNILAGYQFSSGFMISANYTLGLSNLLPSAYDDLGKMTNNNFAIKIGYTLHKK